MAIFSNPAHQRLVADDEVRTLLQRGAWARLLRKHPTAFLLLLQAGFPVWRSRIYRALLDIPEIRNLPKAAVGLYLRHIEPENVVQLLRGPGYDELSKDGRKRQPPRRRQLRSRLRSREFRRLLDYAEYNTTTRWNIEHWIEDQQYPYSALTWLTDLSFFGELHSDRSANLERASQLEGRVPAFYYRVGELLERRAAGAPGAVEAYLKAIDSDDPQILHKLGVRLKDLGQLDASLRAFRRGLENDPDCRLIAEWQHRSAAASVLWAQGSLSEAIDELERIKHASDVSWRSQVVEAMSDAVKSAAEARLLRDWLDSVRPRGDPAIREHGALADFHEAMLSLAARRDEPRPAQAWIPVVTPVALEIQVRLIPREDGWEAEHPLFKECMPKMRARIEREMGVRVPGVRVRSDKDAPAGSYTILLDEVSEITGVVFANAFFCSSAETVTRLSKGKPPLGAGVDPLTGRAGAWIAVSDVKGAARAKAEMWDPFEYMVRHVEAVLRGRLDTFVGVQELQDMLDSWELHLQAAPDQAPEEDGTTPSRHDLIARALPDTAARLQLLQVLQRLLRDRVPIADLRTILEVFASRSSMEVSDAHLIEVTEAIRLRLRKSLPGNRAESLFVYLAPEIEAGIDAHITESDGRRHLALPAADRTALLKAIRRTFDGLPAPDPVIVTRRDGIRPNVNELVAPEFPRTAVLWSKELLPTLRRKASAMIEYASPAAPP